jgi:endonuclease YncB( thermonuclease family)
MFAFPGIRNAFKGSTLSAFFVSRLKFFRLRIFSLIVLGLVAGCSEDNNSARHSEHQPPAFQSSQQSVSKSSVSKLSPLKHQSLKSCSPFSKTETVKVARVYDGDTLTLSDGRKIRLVGINATEVARERKPDQPFAQQAKRAVQEFLNQSQRVELLVDTEAKDHYGRWLGYIYNGVGESLGQSLLQQGLAYHVAIPPNLSLAECFAQAEQQARNNQLGLWGNKGLSYIQAKGVYQGGFQRVRGRVTAVHTGKHWHLDLGNHLTVMLYSEHQHRFVRPFTKKEIKSLQGQNIEIQGWVYKSKGQWRIKLETPYGVELL